MSNEVDDLRATSDAIRADAARVSDLEAEKRALDPTDPRVGELSRRIETLADGLSVKAGAERAISDEIQEQAG